MASVTEKALALSPPRPRPPAAETIAATARRRGLGPWRQFREMCALRFGPGKLAFHEYFSSGAFDPALSRSDKREFIGKAGSRDINQAASPAALGGARFALRDKVSYLATLRQLGLPAAEVLAVAHRERSFEHATVLRSVDGVAAFLRKDTQYPVLLTPCSGALGAVLVTGRSGEILRLGNGRAVDLTGFAREIFEDYPDGFVFQRAVTPHPDLVALAGAMPGNLRIVTLRTAAGIQPLYALWHIPSPRALSDAVWQNGSMVALVDLEAGRVRKCSIGTGLSAEWIKIHPLTGRALSGAPLPHVKSAMSLGVSTHGLYPEFGLLGFDVALGADGPVLLACYDNPSHELWQLAAGRGFRNAEMLSRLEAANARSAEMLATRRAL